MECADDIVAIAGRLFDFFAADLADPGKTELQGDEQLRRGIVEISHDPLALFLLRAKQLRAERAPLTLQHAQFGDIGAADEEKGFIAEGGEAQNLADASTRQ